MRFGTLLSPRCSRRRPPFWRPLLPPLAAARPTVLRPRARPGHPYARRVRAGSPDTSPLPRATPYIPLLTVSGLAVRPGPRRRSQWLEGGGRDGGDGAAPCRLASGSPADGRSARPGSQVTIGRPTRRGKRAVIVARCGSRHTRRTGQACPVSFVNRGSTQLAIVQRRTL